MSDIRPVNSSTNTFTSQGFRQRVEASGAIVDHNRIRVDKPGTKNGVTPTEGEGTQRESSRGSLSVAAESRLYASAGNFSLIHGSNYPFQNGRDRSGGAPREGALQTAELPGGVKDGRGAGGDSTEQDPRLQLAIASLRTIEAKVKSHEAAHKAAGGTMTGAVQYSYTRGPDGKSYITGGEVPITISSGKTPQETASKMEQVVRAALAPVDPSPQDKMVAAQASMLAQEARLQASAAAASTGKTVAVAHETGAGEITVTVPSSRSIPRDDATSKPSNSRDNVLFSISVKRYSDPAVTGRLQADEESRNRFSEAVTGLLRGFFPSLPISLFA